MNVMRRNDDAIKNQMPVTKKCHSWRGRIIKYLVFSLSSLAMPTYDSLQFLRQFVYSAHTLSSEEWDDFSRIWQPFEARRKTVLTATGETEKYLYFVTEGIQRAFYLSSDDRDATLVFMYPPSFAGVADSFLLQQPSRFYFETLTNSKFIRTSYQQINDLMQRYPNFQNLLLKMLSHILSGVLERQIELQCFSAEQKFRSLLRRSPHVLRLIPHKYLASYLGIDATTFSKLLGSVRID